jgi:hypothetical protein
MYNVNRKGINTFSDGYSESVQQSELTHLQNIFKSDSELYQQRVVDYLFHNAEKFPNEFQTGNDDDMPPDNGSAYSPSIYLGGNNNNLEWYGGSKNDNKNE